MRPSSGTEEAESPFSDLLDSCAASDADPMEESPKAAQGPTTGNAPTEAKPAADKPAEPEIVQANTDGDETEEISAELALLLALGGQPAPEAKEEKPVIDVDDVVAEDPAAKESTPDAEAAQPQTDSSKQADAVVTPPALGPAVAAIVTPISLPSDVPVEAIPASETIKAAAAIDLPAKTGIDGVDLENTSRSDEAIAATLIAQADKNKTSQAEKPTSTAAEQTLTTPAAFRSAADPEIPAPKADASQTDAPEQPAPTPSKDSTAAPKAPRGEIEAPQAKPKMTAPQPLPDAGANTPTPPAPLQASAGPHQAPQPVVVQPNPAADHVPVSGLAVEIAAHAQAGKNHFEIRLDPPELGRIDVRLDIGSDGQVTSHLRVERVETLDLLRRDAPTLERALQQAGLKTPDNGLQFSLRDQSFSWQQQQGRDMPEMARIVMPDETLPSAETQRHYGRLIGLGSGVDIRV